MDIKEKKIVDPNKLCMGCMSTLDRPDLACPYCGFSLSSYKQPQNSLSPYEILNGKYLIGRAIGVGGFGVTYIGWDFYQCKKICIKEYFPRAVAVRMKNEAGLSESLSYGGGYSMSVYTQNTDKAKYAYMRGLQEYIKEAEILSKFFLMSGIVSVRDFFYGNNTAYIVMEYIDGIDMKKYAKNKGGRLEPAELFRLLKDVLKALDAVHQENIIHRDISPDNIMLSREYKAKLIDFGAAKEYQLNSGGPLLLKHGYAPPEQYVPNGNLGPWTDVYSICATIFFLLTGKKIQKAYDRIKKDNYVSLVSSGIPVTDRQDIAIWRGLSLNIEDRYKSIAELYEDLYEEKI